MAVSKIRVVLDTNIWVSYLISNKLLHIDKLLKSESIELIFSDELLLEFIEVTKRPTLRKFFKKSDVSDLLESMHEVGTIVQVSSSVVICRDEKDNFLLSLCHDSKADFLVSGDGDLLTIKKIGKTRIISYSEFINEKIN